jgi:hypothetical protein
VKQRARDLHVVLEGVRASLGPGTRSVSVDALLSWTMIRIGVATDDYLRALAEDLGLDQARTERRGRIWFRQATGKGNGLVVVAAGPYHEGTPPGETTKP